MRKDTADLFVKIIAILNYIWGGIVCILGLGVMFGGSFMRGMMGNFMYGSIMGGLFVAAGLLFIALGVVAIFVGRGLWMYEPWARIVAIIFGVLDLFSFPIGTIIGIAIIYLFGFDKSVIALFEGSRAPARKTKSRRT